MGLMYSELPRVLDTGSARRLGITPAQVRTELRRGRWYSLARGIVLTRPDQPTRADWALVGLCLAGGRSAISGWDALRYYGLGNVVPPVPHVLVIADRGGGRTVGGVRVRRAWGPIDARRAPASHPQLAHELVAAPARAIADTSPMYRTPDPIRAVVTSAVQRGLCTPDALRGVIADTARRGSGHLRRAVVEVLDGARSVAEAAALADLCTAAVPPFELNTALVDPSGRVVAVADFLWRRLRAVLEIDSREFHFSERDWKRTSTRHNRLTAAGFSLLHFSPSQVSAGTGWLDQVVTWLRRRAVELGIDYDPAPEVIRAAQPLMILEKPSIFDN